MSIDRCRELELPKIADARGALSFVEGSVHIPFEIARVYYLYGIVPGEQRGAHGHARLEQLIIPVAGGFDVVVDDGSQSKVVRLNDPAVGLYVCPMIWRDLKNFTPGAVALVLASLRYDEADYFRDYADFKKAVAAQ